MLNDINFFIINSILMFWNNSSYINNERGKSVGGKMASMASRYIEPKFMSKIGQSRIDLPK